jgi:bifunctional ADP-heptose synthase (sugar kinase/adenylyltransferase)
MSKGVKLKIVSYYMAKRDSALTQNIFIDPKTPTTLKKQTEFGVVVRPRTHFFDFTPQNNVIAPNKTQDKIKKIKTLAELDYKKSRISAIHSIFDNAAENQNQMAIKPKPKTWMNRLFSSSRKSGGARKYKKSRKTRRRH